MFLYGNVYGKLILPYKLIPAKMPKVVVPLTDTKIKKTKADPESIQKPI